MKPRYAPSGAPWMYRPIESCGVGLLVGLHLTVMLQPGAAVLGVAVRAATGIGGDTWTGLVLASGLLDWPFANSRNSYAPGVVGIVTLHEPDAGPAAPAVAEQLLV